MGMTGISELHRGPGTEHIVEGVGKESSGVCPLPPPKLNICQSILLEILFKKVLKMLKHQSACHIFTHRCGIISLILPSTSLRPVAEI